ncbi:hypothetical protein ANAPC5_01447 [Anaplasma phagocytophilum]|nr:hypothetical protein ANAPC5_01447 [Anaplasma phagocytophilum]
MADSELPKQAAGSCDRLRKPVDGLNHRRAWTFINGKHNLHYL